jgi:hypothetical protein
MRIEQPRAHETAATEPASNDNSRPAVTSGAGSGHDRVSLSPGLRLIRAALDEAQAANQEIRPAAVERGRALVASGELDADPIGLAALLLPDLIDSHDDDPS